MLDKRFAIRMPIFRSIHHGRAAGMMSVSVSVHCSGSWTGKCTTLRRGAVAPKFDGGALEPR